VAIVILAIEPATETEPWHVRATVDGEETSARVVVNADASCVFIEQTFSELLAKRELEETRKVPYRSALQDLVRRMIAGKAVALPMELGEAAQPKRRWWFW
jgi:hypothetical protein